MPVGDRDKILERCKIAVRAVETFDYNPDAARSALARQSRIVLSTGSGSLWSLIRNSARPARAPSWILACTRESSTSRSPRCGSVVRTAKFAT